MEKRARFKSPSSSKDSQNPQQTVHKLAEAMACREQCMKLSQYSITEITKLSINKDFETGTKMQDFDDVAHEWIETK